MAQAGRYLEFLEKHGEEVVCGFMLTVVSTCVFAQVVSRYVFGTAITWTEEMAGFAMVWAVYMGASLGVRERFHIRIVIGIIFLPRIVALVTILIGDVLWMAFNLFMVWQGWLYKLLMWEQVYISPSLGVDQKWPQSIVFIGYILISARVVQIYVRWFQDGCKGLPGLGKEVLSRQEEVPGS